MLDGLDATTHWKGAELLAERYLNVRVQPNELVTDNGQVLTSAGASAGLDLCRHMIRRDHGAAVAAHAARRPWRRWSGRAGRRIHRAHQAVVASKPVAGPAMDRSPVARRDHAAADLGCRCRQRAYAEPTLPGALGTSPLQWVTQARVARAQCLLETTDMPIERVATAVGFGSPVSLREHFAQSLGTSPTAYRRVFRKATATAV